MGLLQRFKNVVTGLPIQTKPTDQPLVDEAVKLTGTTTFAKDAMYALASRHGITNGGYIEVAGFLQREPANTADPLAVAVHSEGERIGYLPGYLAHSLRLEEGGSHPVRLQIFTENLPTGLRTEAWAWLGAGRPRWKWSESSRPPMSSGAKAAARWSETTAMVDDALAEGGARAQQFRRGMIGKTHYLETIEPIKQLKREGRFEEALEVCYLAITAAEKDAGKGEPAPWYTEQAAIIHRKLKQHDEEVAVLQRWLKHCPADRRTGSRIAERLAELTG